MIHFDYETFCCTSSTAVRRTDEEFSPRTDRRTSRCSDGPAGRANRPPRGPTGCGVAHSRETSLRHRGDSRKGIAMIGHPSGISIMGQP
jgi:hypothetical protein